MLPQQAQWRTLMKLLYINLKIEMKFQNKPNLIKRGSIFFINSLENRDKDFKIIAAGF